MNKKKTRSIFTFEFKQSAVKLVTEQGYTRQEAANNLGVSLSAITRWVRAETQADSKPGALYLTILHGCWLRKQIKQFHISSVDLC